jgi:hypothetical protein
VDLDLATGEPESDLEVDTIDESRDEGSTAYNNDVLKEDGTLVYVAGEDGVDDEVGERDY